MICIQRLLFGIVSSQDIFKRAFDETFNDIPDVYCIADDVLIAARTREEHDLAVNKIIQRCQDSGFRLNPKKAKILLEEINYFGHTLSKKRLKPHMKKIQGGTTVTARNVQLPGKVYTQPGCQDEGPPRSDKEKCRICVGRHIHQDTRNKAEVKDNKTLQYFDPQKEITIECDEGLGACLLQDGTPVNFTSRGLIDAETRYCNLEREMLAVAWAVNHYRQYVYGQRFKIVNDHTPLQQIIKKDIRDTSTWLQRLLQRCQGYDLTIEYKKGVEMHISDCLSRCVPSPAPNLGPVFPETSQIGIFEITAANESDIHKIRSTQKRDPVFQELECLSQEGWPEHHNQVSVLATADWGYRHDIAVIDGNVKSQRSLVPQKMCERLLQKLHRVHQ